MYIKLYLLLLFAEQTKKSSVTDIWENSHFLYGQHLLITGTVVIVIVHFVVLQLFCKACGQTGSR